MASHFGKFKNIETGEIIVANCIDDYFGKREYGYIVEQEGVYTKDAFFKKYSCLSYDEYSTIDGKLVINECRAEKYKGQFSNHVVFCESDIEEYQAEKAPIHLFNGN